LLNFDFDSKSVPDPVEAGAQLLTWILIPMVCKQLD